MIKFIILPLLLFNSKVCSLVLVISLVFVKVVICVSTLICVVENGAEFWIFLSL
ncbi:hypothetical protein ACWIUD_10345 [Helicobacter sp. 23-1044]